MEKQSLKLTKIWLSSGITTHKPQNKEIIDHNYIYHKIPKISPGAYIFQRPFLRGLFLEGLIFGGAYAQREICISKSIKVACSGKEIYHVCFV